MAKKFQIKPHQKKSIISETLDKKKKSIDLKSDGFFLISLRHLDPNQGQSFKDWENLQILADAIDVLKNYCGDKLISQCDGDKFTIYGDFPPEDKTEFKHPTYVPEDAEWARIHVTGEHVLVGHVVENIFFLVFLDYHHKFWISDAAKN